MRPDPGEGLSYESLAANTPRTLGDECLSTKWGTGVAHHKIHYSPPSPWVMVVAIWNYDKGVANMVLSLIVHDCPISSS